jgi:hypothetical protein
MFFVVVHANLSRELIPDWSYLQFDLRGARPDRLRQ